jgi:multidrug efflux pump subunit AcrA (membrane-fusion protein)
LLGGLLGAWGAWRWLPNARNQPDRTGQSEDDHGEPNDGHTHDHDHGHEHAGHDDSNSIELSKEAQSNIGLQVEEVAFRPFERTVNVPAIIVERPGRSRVAVTAPITGVVTQIFPLLGQSLDPGQPLFEMRLTHEELVQAQTDYLKSIEELDVVNREIARLERVAVDGAIAGKVVLERKYEQQKLDAIRRAQEQALILHGLTEEEVASVRENRRLLQFITIRAPQTPSTSGDGHSSSPSEPCLLQIQEITVASGQQIEAGEPLCVLADHCELYIEGKAFEQDARYLEQAVREKWLVHATVNTSEGIETIPGLRILSLGNRIDPESRTFSFFAQLTNQVVRDTTDEHGHRFVDWSFRPGQRVQVQVPIETWPERIVLPAEAVVEEGPESYVFVQDDDHFHRQSVRVQYRDPMWVVLAEENDLWPGDSVAVRGAQQLQLALKSKSGGGIDPHAGHSH